MFKTDGLRLTSFWQFQAAGWVCFCLLSVLVVIPYVRQPSELGYQSPAGLFADQGLMCLACILASLVLRPLCHSLVQRSLSWIALEIRAAGWSLAIGTSTALLMSRLALVKPEPLELWEACAKTFVLLFLWCNLYFSIKQSQMYSKERIALRRDETIALSQNSRECISRFSVRTGQRIQVVPSEDVGWISAAGDYVELHTRSATHLVRDTMNSLGQKLDPGKFIRIHRSKIINLDCILELRSIENREFIVKLCDAPNIAPAAHMPPSLSAGCTQDNTSSNNRWLTSSDGQFGDSIAEGQRAISRLRGLQAQTRFLLMCDSAGSWMQFR